MKTKLTLMALLLAAATISGGCRSSGYRLPATGVSVSDASGLQITATRVKAGRRGFTVSFDLVNESDTGLLVPFTNLEAAWGDSVANVSVEPRRFRKLFTCTDLRLAGAIDSGLFEGTHWVTGRSGEPPPGEAIYLKPRSRIQRFDVDCTVPPQPGTALLVRWPRIYSGDARGTIDATVANGVTWVMESTAELKTE